MVFSSGSGQERDLSFSLLRFLGGGIPEAEAIVSGLEDVAVVCEAILHATGVMMRDRVLTTGPLTVFRIDPTGKMIDRIEAGHAKLMPGTWFLVDARVLAPGQMPMPARAMFLPTDVNVSRIQQSFPAPDTLSF